jgi:hypothetical protein
MTCALDCQSAIAGDDLSFLQSLCAPFLANTGNHSYPNTGHLVSIDRIAYLKFFDLY